MSVRAYAVSKPLLAACTPARRASGVYGGESGESRGEDSPPELGRRAHTHTHTHTHTLTGEVQQWLEEGKIQQHFLIYGL